MCESTEPCGTQFMKCLVVEVLPLYFVCACLLERKSASHFMKLKCISGLKSFSINRWRGTMLKALLMLMAAISVLCAGFC